MNYNNQNYNNYNQGYDNYNGYDNQGYNDYNQYNNNNGNNNNGNNGGGLFSTLFALAALIALVYILLRLLGIDAIDYIEKYLPNNNNKTEEKQDDNQEEKPDEEKPVEVVKTPVKDTIKGFCSKVDSNGNYLLEELDEDESLDGKLTFCQDNICYFSRPISSKTEDDSDKDEEKDKKKDKNKNKSPVKDEEIDYEVGTLYTYSCKEEIYTEMPAKKAINELRVEIACASLDKDGNFTKEMSDGTKITCSNNTCHFDNNGVITTHSCQKTAE